MSLSLHRRGKVPSVLGSLHSSISIWKRCEWRQIFPFVCERTHFNYQCKWHYWIDSLVYSYRYMFQFRWCIDHDHKSMHFQYIRWCLQFDWWDPCLLWRRIHTYHYKWNYQMNDIHCYMFHYNCTLDRMISGQQQSLEYILCHCSSSLYKHCQIYNRCKSIRIDRLEEYRARLFR